MTDNSSTNCGHNQPFEVADYVQVLAAGLQLPIPQEMMPEVVREVERLWKIAQPVLDFPLSDDVEMAPRFEP